MEYTSKNYRHIAWWDIPVLRCYICKELLKNDPSKEHIIPQTLFAKGALHRPALPVHEECNREKSLDDKWFSLRLLIRAQHNPKAAELFENFLKKADDEIPTDPNSESKEIRNYKLALTLFEDAKHIGKEDLKNHIVPDLRFGDKSNKREEKYIKLMAEGLTLRSMPFSDPEAVEVIISQYEGLKRSGLYEKFIKDTNKFFRKPKEEVFSQKWGNELLYIGNPKLGMVFIEFFNQVSFTITMRSKSRPVFYIKKESLN